MSSGAYYVMGDIKGGSSFRHSFAAILREHGAAAPRVLYLGAACNDSLYLKTSFENGLAKTCPESVFKSLNLRSQMAQDHEDVQPENIAEQFLKADIIFFDGGRIRALQETYEQFNLKTHAKRAFERGAYVGGLCAGGSYMCQEAIFSEDDYISRQKGAGLIEGTAISCHMDMPDQYGMRLYHLYQAATDNGMCAIGLGVNQAVLFKNGVIYKIPAKDVDHGSPLIIDACGKTTSIELLCG